MERQNNTPKQAGTKRAVIYARVSTDEQAIRGFSIQSQLESCRKYAHEHDFKVIAEFTDDITGTKIDRPGLDALRELVQAQPVDAVIVHDLDRFSRKPSHLYILEEELERRGAKVHYVLGQYEDSPEGKLLKGIRAELADFEREKIRERAMRGKKTKAKAGLYVGVSQAPYGYSRVKEGRVLLLIPNKKESRIVRLIFEWYVFGEKNGCPLSQYEIANKLAKMGVPSPSVAKRGYEKRKRTPAAQWNMNAIGRILQNETYAGVWHYFKTDYAAWRNGSGSRRMRPKEEWLPVPVPEIVDRALWKKAQERLKHNRHRTRPRTKNQYLMQSRLFCSECGRRFAGVLARDRHLVFQYYVCPGTRSEAARQFPTLRCSNRQVRGDVVDAKTWEFITDILAKPEVIIEGMRQKQGQQMQAQELLGERVQIVEEKLAELRATLSNLIDRYVDAETTLTRELFAEKQEQVERQITALQKEQIEIQERLQATVISDEAIETIEAIAKQVRDKLGQATFEQKRQMVEMLDVRGQLKRVGAYESVLELSCMLDEQSTSAILRAFERRKAANPISDNSLSSHQK